MKQRLWDSMLDAARMRRYYLALYKRYRNWHLRLSVVVLVGSILAAANLLVPTYSFNQLISALLFLVVAVVTVFMVVYDYSRQAQAALSAHLQLQEIEVAVGRLWHQDDPNMLELEFWEDRIDSVTRDDLVYDEVLNIECSEEAEKVVKSYYGPEPNKNGTSSAHTART